MSNQDLVVNCLLKNLKYKGIPYVLLMNRWCRGEEGSVSKGKVSAEPNVKYVSKFVIT